ncbi:EAL domain-containing protein [Ponticaulis profundi]|uniref:EAL domain-containing protein n=1 Tax=Ponticaulis profundi TaxID=2665222 RepID=A0ABW1SCV8_9PROT
MARSVCEGCQNGKGFSPSISMAFQPILDMEAQSVFGHEALVRGTDGAGAGSVLSLVDQANRYDFDQKCRVTAIETAAKLDLNEGDAFLSINFLPNAVYEPRACIRTTLLAATRCKFPIKKIMFEFNESEYIEPQHILNILRAYQAMGFATAIDDFGAGYAGLDLITRFQPDFVKIDMALIRDIDQDQTKRTVLKHTLAMLRDLGTTPICEGIETFDEYTVLRDMGVTLMQGYLMGRPEFEGLANPIYITNDANSSHALRA